MQHRGGRKGNLWSLAFFQTHATFTARTHSDQPPHTRDWKANLHCETCCRQDAAVFCHLGRTRADRAVALDRGFPKPKTLNPKP